MLRDVPELAELGEPRLKQPDRRGIMIQIQVVIPSSNERNGDVCLGRDARIDAAIADVSDLETAVATVLQKANPIVRRLVAEMEVRAQRRCQGGQGRVWLFRDDSDLEISLGT